MTMTIRETVFVDIEDEMERQEDKWGADRHLVGVDNPEGAVGYLGDGQDYFRSIVEYRGRRREVTWADILLEEVAEAFDEPDESDSLRTELVQVAAVVASWIEDIDRVGQQRIARSSPMETFTAFPESQVPKAVLDAICSCGSICRPGHCINVPC